MTKHARFLQIEPGDAEHPPESEAANRGRIAAVLESAPASTTHVQFEIGDGAQEGDARPPFEGPAMRTLESGATDVVSDPACGIELSVAAPQGQPFVRCVQCGADSSIHASECERCSARLDGREQQAFNEALWGTRLRQIDEERAALDQMAAARYDAARRATRPLPEPGMKPPPELLEAPGDGPILLAMLERLKEPKWRWAAGAAAAGLPLLLVTFGGPLMSAFGWVLVAVFFLLLLPRRVGRRVVERWLEGKRQR